MRARSDFGNRMFSRWEAVWEDRLDLHYLKDSYRDRVVGKKRTDSPSRPQTHELVILSI